MLPAEVLVVNAYERVRSVTEIRVRWMPYTVSGNMLGKFLIVVDLLAPDEELQRIQQEIAARVGPMPFDLTLDYVSMVEAISYPDYPVIMRRSWQWYYETGHALPKTPGGADQ